MPELPEVITVTKDLRKEILGETLIKFDITNPFRKITLTQQIHNKRIKDIFNLGKQIIIELENPHNPSTNDYYLSIHLGMTGQLLLNKTDKYEKVILYFSNDKTVYFSDIRKFGHLKVLSREQVNKHKSNLGINILETFDEQKLIKRLQKRKIPVKNALLDQKLISGAGNIYATDALFLSKINPNKPTSAVTESQYQTLFKNLQLLLNEGIEHRGSSMNRYLDLYGEKGSHQEHFRVYKKRNQLCPQCSNPLVFEKLNGRGSYYCANCQK
jgi:formamidopyrimidine-DNA glycosylase